MKLPKISLLSILYKIYERSKSLSQKKYLTYYETFKNYTMVRPNTYISNLQLVDKYFDSSLNGHIVECGSWKGGMIAGISKLIGNGHFYYVFDSFEGLPPAQTIDGEKALSWQSDTSSDLYYDNCRAEQKDVEKALSIAGITNYRLVKGWFNESLTEFPASEKISLLRLDGDWYDSTLQCLEALFPKVSEGGLVIIDDYYAWQGCAQAVHDYLSNNSLSYRIRQFNNDVAFIIKQDEG